MRRVAAALVVVVFAVGAAVSYVPWLTQQGNVVTGTPSLEGISVTTEVKVPRRHTACIRPVPLDPGVHDVRMLVNAKGDKSWPLELTVRGAGYTAHGRFAGYPAKAIVPVVAQLDRAPARAENGELCVRNTGPRTVGLVGTSEGESLTLPVTYINGTAVNDIDPAITFLAGERRSVLDRSGTILDRAASFTGVVPRWLMWPLALLLVLGVPAAVAAALMLATPPADEKGRPGRPERSFPRSTR